MHSIGILTPDFMGKVRLMQHKTLQDIEASLKNLRSLNVIRFKVQQFLKLQESWSKHLGAFSLITSYPLHF